jgi:hypothetical protein
VKAQAPLQQDITHRASSMGRNCAILYPNTKPKSKDSPAYAGVLRLSDGRTFWALAWERTVKARKVIELELVEKINARSSFP